MHEIKKSCFLIALCIQSLFESNWNALSLELNLDIIISARRGVIRDDAAVNLKFSP